MTVSWCIHVDVIVAMAVPAKRPDGVDSSGGRSIVICGESSPYKDLTILAKLGGGIHHCVMGLPGSVFTHWVKIFSAPVLSLETVAVERMMSFECPMPLVGPMPLVLALWFLLLLCSQGGESLMVSVDLEEVTHTQFKHLGISKSGKWLHPLHQLLDALCQLA